MIKYVWFLVGINNIHAGIGNEERTAKGLHTDLL
jgi:hypothetical protein